MSPVLTPHFYHASRCLVLLQPTQIKIALSTNPWGYELSDIYVPDYFMEDLFLLMFSVLVCLFFVAFCRRSLKEMGDGLTCAACQ